MYSQIRRRGSSTKEEHIVAIKRPKHLGLDLVTKVIGWPITTLVVPLMFMVETNIIELKNNLKIYII